MRKDEEVKELFYMNLKDCEREFRTKATVTQKGIWITIEFGNLAKVTGRGYLAALQALGTELDKLVE